MASGPNLIRNKSTPDQNKISEKIVKNSYSKRNTPLTAEGNIQLPVIKSDENLKYIEIPTVRKVKIIKRNDNVNTYNKISETLKNTANHTNLTNRNLKPIQQQNSFSRSKLNTTETPIKEEDSLAMLQNQMNLENSVSYAKRKSPYYFNDPKASKLMEIKQKFKYKKHFVNPGNDLNFISDGGGNSLEEYEIL
jgi:hypothetical protein